MKITLYALHLLAFLERAAKLGGTVDPQPGAFLPAGTGSDPFLSGMPRI